MAESNVVTPHSPQRARVPSRTIRRVLRELRALSLAPILILSVVMTLALILNSPHSTFMSHAIWLGVFFLIVCGVYIYVRRRVFLLTETLVQRIADEQMQFDQATQSAEAQSREQQVVATMARNFAECLLQNVTCPVLVADAAGLLVSANPAAQIVLGSDIIQAGESITDWAMRQSLQYPSGQPVPPGAVPLTQTLRESRATERTEFLLSKDQRPRMVEFSSVPILSADGSHCTGAVAVLQDVTDMRSRRQQEVIAQERLAALVRLSQNLAAAISHEHVYEIVTEAAVSLLPPESVNVRAAFYGLSDEDKRLTLLSEAPDRRPRRPRQGAQQPGWPFNAQSPFLWQLYVSRQSVVSDDMTEDKRFDDDTIRHLISPIQEVPAKSLLAVPIMTGKQVIGHLMVTSSREGAFSDEQLQDAFVSVAALAAIAHANVLLSAGVRQRTTEMEALWTVSQAVASLKDMAEFADTLTKQICSVFGAELCTLSLWETMPEGDCRLRYQEDGHGDALLPGQTTSRPPAGCVGCDNLSQQAAIRGEPAMAIGIVNPSFGDCRWRAFAGQSGVHSVLASPLRQGGVVIGALTVYRTGDTPFLPQEIRLLATFGILSVAAI